MNAVQQLRIPSIPENVRVVEQFIEELKEQLHINDDIYGNIMIAVTESVNNAIIHGNRSDHKKLVDLSMHIDDKKISFSIKDEGKGFNYNNLPDPTAPENLLQPGGRGIFIIKHLADEVEFLSQGSQVNLTFYLT
ncbi:ATP-binding protein [Rhodoflexus caldus]|uniref:ATP-binding protein n=1 Tax=Rhodoflexus caldus TaxID=2891236 RepID=UPI00202A9855|nr:ATP-binding protein [Rhodoflexus caldus]